MQRIEEQIVAVPIPQITEDIVEDFKMVPQEHFSERICEQILNIPVPQVDVQEITHAIEALQFQVRAMSNETQGKHSGKEERLTKKHELNIHLNECFQGD